MKNVRLPACLIALSLLAAAGVHAQTAPAPAAKKNPNPADATVELSPFEVSADSDKSYGALNSNSITSFNTELKKLPISADIFTEAFMKDVGGHGVESLITTFSAGAGIATSDPSTSAATTQPGDRNGNQYIQLRGLNVPLLQRDSLMPVGAFSSPGSTGVGKTDTFDIERVELIRGPQSLLYGAGGAGGVVNVTSKPARFDSTSGEVDYEIDQYGSKRRTLDANVGNSRVAARLVVLDSTEDGRRINVGGDIQGVYLQLAVKVFSNTTLRLIGEETAFKRINSTNITFSNAATGDPRNGLKLHYLLLTNQTGANNPVTGAAYASGAIDNGRLNWGNVDSYQGWQSSELVTDDFTTLTADTAWNSWLSTQVSAGYNDYRDDRVTVGSFSFYAPGATGNTQPGWALAGTPGDSYQPVRTKAARFSALAKNDLFGGRVKSETILGTDFTRTDYGQIAYAYWQADANFNAIGTNTIPGVTANGGRTAMPKLFWGIDNGPLLYPYFPARSNPVTINGVNYVRQLSNPPNATIASPTNPHGVILGGANYIITKYINSGIFGVNNLHFMDDRLETLFGFRAVNVDEDRLEQGSAAPAPPTTRKQALTKGTSFNVGANYAVLSWLRPYVALSDSYDPPVVMQVDPAGKVVVAAQGIGGEAGLKFNNADNTLSGSLSVYQVNSKNEEILASSTIQNDINPSGLNGRFGASNQWLNVDRKSGGAELVVTAAPSPNWRIRMSAASVDGTIGTTKAYNQFYNDQFHTDGSGNVTYADGTVVWVPNTPSSTAPTVNAGTANATPLTTAMIGDKTSLYWANPAAVNGSINSSSAVATVLKSPTAALSQAHGTILTGVTGLPISAIQYNAAAADGTTPPGTLVAVQKGDKTQGYYQYSANLTNMYTLPTGPLKGLRLGGSVILGWKYRDYYYYPKGIVVGGPRVLYYSPDLARCDLNVGYSRKFGRYLWSTQVNVTNLFNRYHVVLLPNATTGYMTLSGLDATFDQQPRAFTWVNSISF